MMIKAKVIKFASHQLDNSNLANQSIGFIKISTNKYSMPSKKDVHIILLLNYLCLISVKFLLCNKSKKNYQQVIYKIKIIILDAHKSFFKKQTHRLCYHWFIASCSLFLTVGFRFKLAAIACCCGRKKFFVFCGSIFSTVDSVYYRKKSFGGQ